MSTADAALIALGKRFERRLLEHMDAWLAWAPLMRAARTEAEATWPGSPSQYNAPAARLRKPACQSLKIICSPSPRRSSRRRQHRWAGCALRRLWPSGLIVGRRRCLTEARPQFAVLSLKGREPLVLILRRVSITLLALGRLKCWGRFKLRKALAQVIDLGANTPRDAVTALDHVGRLRVQNHLQHAATSIRSGHRGRARLGTHDGRQQRHTANGFGQVAAAQTVLDRLRQPSVKRRREIARLAKRFKNFVGILGRLRLRLCPGTTKAASLRVRHGPSTNRRPPLFRCHRAARASLV